MKTTSRLLLLAAFAAAAAPAMAQNSTTTTTVVRDTTVTVSVSDSSARDAAEPAPKPKPTAPRYIAPAQEIQYLRHADQRGINVFESPKEEGAAFTGMKLNWGGAFAQQFQNLTHENTAAPRMTGTGTAAVNANQLIAIGSGFNNANANLYLNVQLAKGIRVAVETYASSRHHQETWIKDGYFLIDASPIENKLLDNLMQYVTVKAGHFEVNYGDQHFRRSDNGQTLYNPFIGNFVLDAFTTEIGSEVYLRSDGILLMAGVTAGEVHGQVTAPGQRGPTYLLKGGIDEQLSEDLRVRLTGSMYKTDRSASNTLSSGDRGGSRYYDVLENTTSTETANAWSGAIQTGMRNMVTAFVFNPFVKFKGAEFFGNVETMTGAGPTEAYRRTIRQLVGEGLYRFADDKLYLGGRYNTVKGQLAGMPQDISVQRAQLGGGWFMTPNVLTKLEFVKQTYGNFPTTDIRNGGKFQGFMVEGVVAF
ncbi:MAG: hypothetical protein JWN79_3221 [Gemmatimonadetes bacterium]|jgi:hypothetical protein|nr:hypothetical protein [Gemmatimonadota bacterium]